MNRIHDVIIIGGGPAGYSAALYASRAGLDTLLIERLGAGGQMTLTDVIDNYPGFDEGVDGFTLGAKMQAGAERFGTVTEYGEVLSVSLGGRVKTVTTDSGERQARTVVIGTGAEPRRLGVKGESELFGRGVHYCAHCDGRFYKDRDVIVVGGGNSAVSDALYLSKLARKVYLVHRRDTLRATKIYHEPLKAAENVEILFNSALTEILADERVTGGAVKDLITGEVRSVAADGVFISIGREPTTAFLGSQVELDPSGYIVAGEDTRTSAEGVYAVGDVRTKALRQVVTAAADGAVAAHYIEEYISLVPAEGGDGESENK